MSALKTIFALSLLLACSPRTSPKVSIYDNTLYGDITDGRPDKDTLSSSMDDSGRITGKGKVAVAGNEISILKTRLWKEFYESGPLRSEGEYNIGSYVDCCTGGLCRIFYHYRTGQWKYYDLNGNVIYEVEFMPSKLHINTRCDTGDSLTFGLIKNIPAEYWNIITPDKIYEIQKITVNELDRYTTFIPLNGELFIEIRKKE